MSTPEEYVIDVEDLHKSFDGKEVVMGATLRVKKGEIYGFLGPNGSGKTTTLRMICGLLTPDSGRGQCLGYDVLTESAQIKKHVGYMTQKFSLYDDLSVRENLEFMARLYQTKDRKKEVEKAILDLGLEDRRDQLAGTLSGGWKQRLALSAALLHNPQVLLLDEPTAGVDPKARRDFWDQVHRLSAEGITTLVTTHYMDEAERCTRLAYIAYGHMLASGSVQEIIDQSQLTTWEVKGDQLVLLQKALRGSPGVSQVAAFGNELHVSGSDAALLQKAIRSYQSSTTQTWKQISPGLEDVFIHLVKRSDEE